jgi:K+-transporting ATPase ATPase C chain
MTSRAQLRPAVVTFVLLTLLTGLVYPLLVTGIAQIAMPNRANGSLVTGSGGKVIGSSLIGQNFSDPRYFWGRPSATAGAPYTPYDGKALTGSSGSNLGPLSADLRKAVANRIAALRAADPSNTTPIPADMVTASASGLDPDISVAAALYQAPRVARARAVDETTVRGLIAKQTQGRWLGVFGEPRVNVLALNLALDKLQAGVK